MSCTELSCWLANSTPCQHPSPQVPSLSRGPRKTCGFLRKTGHRGLNDPQPFIHFCDPLYLPGRTKWCLGMQKASWYHRKEVNRPLTAEWRKYGVMALFSQPWIAWPRSFLCDKQVHICVSLLFLIFSSLQLNTLLRDVKILHNLFLAFLLILFLLSSNLLHEAVQDTIPSVDNVGCAKPLTHGAWWSCQPHRPLSFACLQAHIWVFIMSLCLLKSFLPPHPRLQTALPCWLTPPYPES